jgi:hypothetical protein
MQRARLCIKIYCYNVNPAVQLCNDGSHPTTLGPVQRALLQLETMSAPSYLPASNKTNSPAAYTR